ncbi:MAG: hypothetical protein ABJO01_03300 [Parasphingorhabdus sp.]|uniref:hypothetical protein n=2 Tax=Parasphingorhabdus sp. TaxID=2709688 RepID=UPI003298BD8D
MFKKIFVNQPEIKGSKSHMNRDISVERDLGQLAALGARLLATPFLSITVYDGESDPGSTAVQTVSHVAAYCDEHWAAANPQINISQLGSPRNAMTQHLGLYASLPLRNDEGETIGTLACAGDEARDLSEQEMGVLKSISALTLAVLRGSTH